MKVLKNLTEEELRDFVQSLGEKAFRGSQIFQWISKGAKSFDDINNIPKSLKEKLINISEIGNLSIAENQISKSDGTQKFLFELNDGNYIEAVFMKYKYGNSICISSQAGCRMGCKFCASGMLGLVRNLEPWEMLDQIIKAMEFTGKRINHIVVMGTGEPFDNYENLSKFIKLVNAKSSLGIGMRNITVSTCGLVPFIEKFADDFPQVNLAISLHASNDQARREIMPIAQRYELKELIDACSRYTDLTGRRITFEYTVVKGINDSKKDVNELVGLLRGMNAHVNLIPLNDTVESGLVSAGRMRAKEIAEELEVKAIRATVRRSLGRDIDAACGQLRLKNQKI